jgi:hypothetical protein
MFGIVREACREIVWRLSQNVSRKAAKARSRKEKWLERNKPPRESSVAESAAQQHASCKREKYLTSLASRLCAFAASLESFF